LSDLPQCLFYRSMRLDKAGNRRDAIDAQFRRKIHGGRIVSVVAWSILILMLIGLVSVAIGVRMKYLD